MAGILMVFLGGGLGAVSRYGVTMAALRLFGPDLPVGTFIANVAGSFTMGLFWAYVATHLESALPVEWRLLIATGFLGGFTTFSTFSLDAVSLWESGETGLAIAYVAASVVLSLGALIAGQWIARNMMTPWPA